METQTPHPLSLRTRDDARAALARAFEEAATMPGTLLPPEMVTELTEMAGRILQEVLQLDDRDVEFGNGKPAWAYIVEHSIDATVASCPRTSSSPWPPACSCRTSASWRCRSGSCRSRARWTPASGS